MNASYKVRGLQNICNPLFYSHYLLKFQLATGKYIEFETCEEHEILNAV